jgi:hypothetical protein
MYDKMYGRTQSTTRAEVETNCDLIKIRFVFSVPFKYKDYAKDSKLRWDSTLKHWFYDLQFDDIHKAKEFINDEEQEFIFPNNNIFNFKIKQLIEKADLFEAEEYGKLIDKFSKFQNILLTK